MSDSFESSVSSQTFAKPFQLEIDCIGLDWSIRLNLIESYFTNRVLYLQVVVVSTEVQESDRSFEPKDLLEFHESFICRI
jgi:hypothetical protein